MSTARDNTVLYETGQNMLSQHSYINRINVIKRPILRERMSWLYFNHDIESSTAIIKAVLCESFYYHCVINLQQKLQRNQ